MEHKATPLWARILEIIPGIIIIILAGYIIFNPNVAIDLLRVLLGVGLIILGLVLAIRGWTSEAKSGAAKVLSVILGIIVLVLGITAIVYTSIGTGLLIFLLAVGLLLNAIGRISFAGYSVAVGMPSWIRWSSMVLGVIALILAIGVIIFPGIGEALLVILVAVIFVLFGIQLILTGLGSRSG